MNLNFELLHDEFELALGGLDERQTQLRPRVSRDRWSIQQIVGHLALTYAATVDAMEARITKGSPTLAKPTLAQRTGQFALLRIGYFPRGRQAPPRVTPLPENAMPSGNLIANLTDGLREMDRKTAAAEAVFGRSHRTVRHMVLGPLSIDQWRKFHLIHGRHHIKQIRAIRAEHKV